jgi:hypothetical protein
MACDDSIQSKVIRYHICNGNNSKKTYHLSSTISAWLCINHIITLSSNNIKHLTNKDHTIMQLSCTFMNHSQSYHDMPQSLIINDSLCTEKRPFPTWPIGRPSWQATSSCHLVRTVGVKETANHPSNQQTPPRMWELEDYFSLGVVYSQVLC